MVAESLSQTSVPLCWTFLVFAQRDNRVDEALLAQELGQSGEETGYSFCIQENYFTLKHPIFSPPKSLLTWAGVPDYLSTCVFPTWWIADIRSAKTEEYYRRIVLILSHTVSAWTCNIPSRCSEALCACDKVMRGAAAPTLSKGSHFRFYEWADGLFGGGGVSQKINSDVILPANHRLHHKASQQTNCSHQPLPVSLSSLQPHFSSPNSTQFETRHSPF